MDQLFLLFDKIKPLSPELRAYIQQTLVLKKVKKNEIILREGETAKHIYFIVEGCVRSYRLTKKGKERTAWIMKEWDIFLAVRSFFPQIPATEFHEALEDCILYCITYEQLEKAYELFPEFNLHGRKILEYYYILSENRHEMREQPAFDRFSFLMTNQPDLVGRVPDKLLASYLNMAPETFSAQKGKFAKWKGKK